MKRLMDWHLEQWKVDPHRKPLLIRGARQVGKTYGVRQLGKKFDHFIEINFEQRKDANKIFEKNLVPERIVQELSLFSGKEIVPGKTLLFFDEIQECPEAIQSMRYFFEEMPSLHPFDEVETHPLRGGRKPRSFLNRFLESHSSASYGVRFSAQNYSIFQKIDSRPLYAVASLAHEEQAESLRALL